METKWTSAKMPSLAGKTILVTGANSGIGYQAAAAFARHGASVVLGCRNRKKGEAAAARIRSETPAAVIEVAELDMASLASVRTFASGFLARNSALDILVNNAGVMALATRELTEDGFERQFATNHLGHFALTGLLLPALQRSFASRVVTVASLAHRNGKMDWDNLQGERSYDPWGAYGASKLANILFARELHRRAQMAELPLLSIPVHPGVSRTNIFENGPGTGSLKAKILQWFAPLLTQDEAQGALPTEFAATAPGVQGGQYIGPDGFGELKGFPKVVQPRPQALDDAAARRLWEVSEELTGVRFL